MRLRILAVGKIKSAPCGMLIEEYLSRLSRFIRCEVVTVREAAASCANDPRRALDQEGTALLNAISSDAYVTVLDVDGECVTSHALANRLRHHQNAGTKDLCFVIGGHYGVSHHLRQRADWRWSLSPLTFTHEMAQVLLAEQLYRAFTIINGHPYSK